jgi:hypothetical protein
VAARTEQRDSARSPYGPRPLSAVLPALVRPAFRGRTAATALVLADWPAIVGPAYAPRTTPLRLVSGTLTIGCSGPLAMELQHVAPALIERVNAHLGRVAVTRLRFVQTAPPPMPATARAVPRGAADVALPGVRPGELRDALERLGQAVLARQP